MKSRITKIIAVVVAIIVITGFFVVAKKTEKKVSYEQNVETGIQAVQAKLAENIVSKDSDNDGLPDWEEALWKTDPQNPDSDGDKTTDGDEVKNNRNPLAKGPDDSMEKAETEKVYEDLTQTEKLSRDIFVEYLNAKMQGTYNETSKGQILQTALEKNAIGISSPTYSTEDISVTDDESADSAKRYQESFFAVFTKYFRSDAQNEQKIFYEALQNENSEIASQLKAVAELYRLSVKELVGITVPKGAVLIHLEIANTLSVIAESLELMSKVATDPLTAMVGYKNYDEAGSYVFELVSELSLYVEGKTNIENLR